jgi:hypothetical protein
MVVFWAQKIFRASLAQQNQLPDSKGIFGKKPAFGNAAGRI